MTLLAITVCLAIGAYVAWSWKTEVRTPFLPGETTHGHYQIELACERCHTPFEGVKDDACVDCHGKELELADDSHPRHKFTDPRNADRVAQLDARSCITCHIEHRPELTASMGLTLPEDYCYRCHDDIAEERPTHADLGFDTCATDGCHNFHDNRALHEDYLEAHMGEPAMADEARLRLLVSAKKPPEEAPLVAAEQDAPAEHATEVAISAWAGSAHAQAGVNCSGCHRPDGDTEDWVERPDHEACRECHKQPVKGFLAGKHGMRLAEGMSPMRPEMARLPMRKDAHGRELSCNSCHPAHEYDRLAAAAEACLGCHADTHSLAFESSPHGRLWAAERAGEAPEGTGVSCATCHLPRVARSEADVTRFTVQHNQNDNLRPNEKMIRGVCADCHGVAFAIDALADQALIDRNFTGRPSDHVESMDFVRRKLAAVEASRAP